MLTKKSSHAPQGAQVSSPFVHSLRRGLSQALPTMDRRAFLRRSGLGVGVGLAATQLTLVKKAKAADGKSIDGSGKIEVKRTICTHCSVGCATDAIVENGVWVRQEPVFDSPINLGAHCAKGAALREHGHGSGCGTDGGSTCKETTTGRGGLAVLHLLSPGMLVRKRKKSRRMKPHSYSL